MKTRKVDNIEQEIATAKNIVNLLTGYTKNEVATALTDQRFTLDARWRLFMAVEVMLPVHPYGSDWGVLKSDSEEDDYSTDRYSTVYFSDRAGMLEEMLAHYTAHEELLRYTQEDIDAWKERVLASGYRGFVYDEW